MRTHRAFASKFLDRVRDVLVVLPPGYEKEPKRRYPVFYLSDGQNLFDGATAFIPGQEWRADEAARELIASGKIPPVILVGVYNAGERRLHEYTPTAAPLPNRSEPLGGGADAYGRFLVEELKPFLDRTYRTRPGPNDTALGGSSLGGLVSLYLGYKHPRVFGKLAVLSPSVWWDDRFIARLVLESPRTPARVWLDIGTDEGRSALNDARLLRAALTAKGWREGRDLRYTEAEGAKHNEAAWAARFPAVLAFLFGKP